LKALQAADKTMAPSRRSAARDPNQEKVIKVSEWNKIRERADQSTQLARELKLEKSKNGSLRNQTELLANDVERHIQSKRDMQMELDKKDQEMKNLKLQIEDMAKALRKRGKVAACELNEELKDRVENATKVYLFRIVKFVEDDEDLKELTEDVIQYLPNKEEDIKPLSVQEFKDLYFLVVNEGIKFSRQYVGNEGKKRVQGKLT